MLTTAQHRDAMLMELTTPPAVIEKKVDYPNIRDMFRMVTARKIVREYAPYFVDGLESMPIKPAPGLGTVGVTRHNVIMADYRFTNGCILLKVAFILAHEFLHRFHRHAERAERLGIRMGTPDGRLWNMCGDVFINSILREMFGGWNPEDALLPAHLELPADIVSAEQAFSMLKQRQQEEAEKRDQEQEEEEKKKEDEQSGDAGASGDEEEDEDGEDGEGPGTGEGDSDEEDDSEESGEGEGGGEDADHDSAGEGEPDDSDSDDGEAGDTESDDTGDQTGDGAGADSDSGDQDGSDGTQDGADGADGSDGSPGTGDGPGQETTGQGGSGGAGDAEPEWMPVAPCHGHCGSGCGGQAMPDEPGKDDEHNVSDFEMEAKLRRVAEAIVEAAKSQGNVPGGLLRLAADVLEEAEVPWEQELSRKAQNLAGKQQGKFDRAFHKPYILQGAVGYGHGKPILPSWYKPELKVDFVIDTSASMCDAEINAAKREVRAIIDAVGGEIYFVSADSIVQTEGKARFVEDITLGGGGGTDFRPYFDSLATRRVDDKPNIIIYATDGFGSAHPTPPRGIDTIWLGIGENSRRPRNAENWGEFIQVKEQRAKHG